MQSNKLIDEIDNQLDNHRLRKNRKAEWSDSSILENVSLF